MSYLRDVIVKKVSFVRKAANKRNFLLLKSEDVNNKGDYTPMRKEVRKAIVKMLTRRSNLKKSVEDQVSILKSNETLKLSTDEVNEISGYLETQAELYKASRYKTAKNGKPSNGEEGFEKEEEEEEEEEEEDSEDDEDDEGDEDEENPPKKKVKKEEEEEEEEDSDEDEEDNENESDEDDEENEKKPPSNAKKGKVQMKKVRKDDLIKEVSALRSTLNKMTQDTTRRDILSFLTKNASFAPGSPEKHASIIMKLMKTGSHEAASEYKNMLKTASVNLEKSSLFTEHGVSTDAILKAEDSEFDLIKKFSSEFTTLTKSAEGGKPSSDSIVNLIKSYGGQYNDYRIQHIMRAKQRAI